MRPTSFARSSSVTMPALQRSRMQWSAPCPRSSCGSTLLCQHSAFAAYLDCNDFTRMHLHNRDLPHNQRACPQRRLPCSCSPRGCRSPPRSKRPRSPNGLPPRLRQCSRAPSGPGKRRELYHLRHLRRRWCCCYHYRYSGLLWQLGSLVRPVFPPPCRWSRWSKALGSLGRNSE